MSCWDRFDHKAVLMYTGHPARTDSIRAECDRVGLVPYESWDAPSAFNAAFSRSIPAIGCMTSGRRPGFFPVTLHHYRIIRTAYELGCRSVLVLENDIRFMRDASAVKAAVESLPADYDVALFDWEPANGTVDDARSRVMGAPRVSGPWVRFSSDLRSFACYAMSRKGMAAWLRFVEEPVRTGRPLMVCDMWGRGDVRDGSLVTYCAVPPVGVQGLCELYSTGEAGGTPADAKIRKYLALGIDLEAYHE